ncbi:MFS transporter [Nonomuraea sp. NPDC003804]|uniref:MFS transporter n=1 Tax=Nonomuraea sp. NPDC003804 TaxID=3154547 RepID=UPI0033B7587C
MLPKLYVYSFLGDFVLFYPVYTLLFTDTGLTVPEITSLLVIWVLAALVLEVPSGALADTLSRKALLIAGPLLGAAGFALWTAVPSYWAFAAGFVLWGAREALESGAFEALVHDNLAHTGTAARYAEVTGRARSISLVATALATAAASPLFAVAGYQGVGVATVLACLLCAAIAATLPEHRAEPEDDDPTGYLDTLKEGLAEARRSPRVRHALLLVPAVTAVWGELEEYVPLLAQESGATAQTVPLMVLLVWLGATSGGLLAKRAAGLRSRGLAALLATGAVALAAGAASGHLAGFVAIAVAFAMFQLGDVLADARLQRRITGPSRATVTSLAGLLTDICVIAALGLYAAASLVLPHSGIFVLFSVPYLVAAWVLSRRTGRPRPDGERHQESREDIR